MSDQAKVEALYGRLSSIRIANELIEESIELGMAQLPESVRDEAADRLDDEDQAAVLRKEVSDVVILVTAALEAPTTRVYRDLVALVEPEPYDEITAPFKLALLRKMAGDALDDVDDLDAMRIVDLLNTALVACGDSTPLEGRVAAQVA